MCVGCYCEYGSAKPTDGARSVGARLRDVNEFGGCHIVREDWNLEDGDIDFCIAQKDTTEAERETMVALKALPIEQRAAAMAVADNYI